jgi:glycosyltransferase involved in cell wall biosynthesis
VACIPAFNVESTIAKVLVGTSKSVRTVLVCDDGSKDMTGEIARGFGVEVITHPRNLGYGAALASLFTRAMALGADVVVTIDADGQHDPGCIPSLVEPIIKGDADIVVGSRFSRGEVGGMPAYRRAGIGAITRLTQTNSFSELTDAQSGLRAIRGSALAKLVPTEQGFGASTEILMKAKENGLRLKEVPVVIDYTVAKPSTSNPFYHGVEVMLSTVKHLSTRHPLIFYGVPGLSALVIAVVFWIWTFQIFAATRAVVTNVTLVAIGATLVGLMLLTTAIILWVIIGVLREARYSETTPYAETSKMVRKAPIRA